MVDFGPAQPMRILNELREYWSSLRQGRAVPLRADVEPQGIRQALDYTFVLERIAPGAARFRLAGRHLVDLMGMEVRGMPLCSFLNPSSRGRLSDVLETVFRVPQIAELRLRANGEFSRPQMDAQMLLLPLRSDLGDVTRALGCLVAEGDIGSAPRRFNLISDRIIPIFAGAEVVPPSPSPREFAESPAKWVDKTWHDKPTPPGIMLPKSTDQQVRGTTPADRKQETPEDRRARFRIIAKND